MSDIHGRFIWYELMTPDIAGAKRFYGDVVGWTAQAMPMDGGEYTLLQQNGAGVAGAMPMIPEVQAQGVPPNWTGYVAVDDCDAAAAKAKALGGAVQRAPQDIPTIGRFAIVADPGGAAIAIMTPEPQDPPRPHQQMAKPGYTGWHELNAAELGKAWAFYEALFGWRKDGDMDMGPMGTYQLFANQDGQVGGMMNKPEQMPAPAWLYYFRVPDIDAAAGKVNAGGGQVLNGPMEVPGEDWVIQALDPQGAMFCLVGKKT
jgi:predicted enzyme related to lactoylglutathione lyase